MYCVFVAILFVVVRNVGMYEIDKVVEEVEGGIIQRFYSEIRMHGRIHSLVMYKGQR